VALGARCLDSVEQLPVALEYPLGHRQQAVGLGAVEPLLDQLPRLRGVLVVAVGVEREVLRGRALLDERIALDQTVELRLGDRGLAGLDRVCRDEALERVGAGRPSRDTRLGLGPRGAVDVGVERAGEVVPEVDMLALLGRMLDQVSLDLRLGRSGRTLERVGQGDHSVAVLAGVVGELVTAELTVAPALIEGVLEHVPALTKCIEAGEEVHWQISLIGRPTSGVAEVRHPTRAVRPPEQADIRAPEFPPQREWLNVAFLRMAKLVGNEATLIEFFDVARINSHRTLPYMREWHARYAEHGLRVIGIHCPGYSFGVDSDLVAAAAKRMGIEYPVLLDPGFEAWREYANRGWPGRYLFDVHGRLHWVHYGEGSYQDCERAIHEVLHSIDPALDLPEPMEPIRPEDAEGVLLSPQTADVVLPTDSDRLELSGEWTEGEDYLEATAAGATARVRSFTAGAAYAVLAGTGVTEPGPVESNGLVESPAAGFRLYGFQFTPMCS
jgi:hypothetical protein